MPIIEESLGAGLSEAVGLSVNGLLEAVSVGLEIERASEKIGVLSEGLRVVGWDTAHVGEIGFDTCLFEAGFKEVLRGANEDTGASADGGAEGREVTAGFRGEEEDDLLSLIGHSDGDAFFTNFFVPGLDQSEPVVGRRVSGAAEEGGYQEIVDGLGGWEIRVKPDFVPGLEVWDLSDGEGVGAAGDVDIDFRACEVKACRIDGVDGQTEAE